MSNSNDINPPKWPLRFLKLIVRKNYLEEIEGDLEEVFHDFLEEHSITKAKRLYALEVFKILRPSLVRKLTGTYRLNRFGLFHHFLKIGWRNLLKEKLYSFINIGGLTVGLTVCLTLLIFVKYESSFDAHHSLAERTWRVVQHTQYPEEEVYWNTTAYPLASALRTDFPELSLVTQMAGPFKRLFSVKDSTNVQLFEEDHVLFTDQFYFQTFDVKWLAGNSTSAFEDMNSVVLSKSVATKYFDDYKNK